MFFFIFLIQIFFNKIMNNFFISLLFLIQILTVLNFDCSGIDENGCKDFTYSGSFINNISEKIDTLNNFYNKISNNSDEKKNFSFKFDEKTVF